MEMMLLSFIGPSMRCEFGVSSREEGAMTSVVFAGMMLGAPSWGVMSDSRGRRPAMLRRRRRRWRRASEAGWVGRSGG